MSIVCGLAGFIDLNQSSAPDDMRRVAASMAAALHHRGPDDQGTWVDEAAGIALAHTRLSVVDLSPAGHQPMVSADGRLVIIYNGEVYETDSLRRELEAAGVILRGHSDTEVILESCARWGVAATLNRLVGMFAFALWDRRDRVLCLVRDRLGIKPLYWGRRGPVFLFGSELKALRAHPDFLPEIDRDALASYLRLNYVPAPECIYAGIHKLPPGQVLTLHQGGEPTIETYWSAHDVARAGAEQPLALDDNQAEEALDALLRRAVSSRMIADVPLGAFLSGGIDSSTVVALMQAQSTRPVRTFSIGFDESAYNEAEHARAVATHLGTDHTELYVRAADAQAVIPKLCEWYDEPFADSSQIPTYLVSALARRQVTVALSGDGGDEVFAGYTRYFWADWLRRHVLAVPRGERLLAPLRGRLPAHPGDKVHKMAEVLALDSEAAIYRRLVTCWDQSERFVAGARPSRDMLWDQDLARDLPGFFERMQYVDSVTYLPDDILTKIDRASMAVSLEARVPLIDHRVVQFGFALPRPQRVRGGKGKWLLRRVLHRYVPPALVERPKMGFGVPVGQWLRGPLRGWAEELITPARLEESGLTGTGLLRQRWQEHVEGRRNWEPQLWSLLIYLAWYRRWMSAPIPTAAA